MTFTYTLSPANDITRVRYGIRDTDSTAAMFSDEEITFRISETGDWKHAVIDMLTGKIAELANTPDFGAGDFRISQRTSIEALQKLLALRRQEYGIALITASANYIYRPDNSSQTSAPTFNGLDDDGINDYDDDNGY